MRLLQVPTSTGDVLDLHPLISVVQGLDGDSYRRLVDTVAGLPGGRAAVADGLIEAHGVLLDLTDDMLSLLDLTGLDVDPVVRRHEIPGFDGAAAGAVPAAESARRAADDEVAAAAERAHIANRAARAAEDALERARRSLADASGDTAARLDGLDELTRRLDALVERRRQLDEEIAAARPVAATATRARATAEAEAAERRERRRSTAARCSELTAALDDARRRRDPGAVAVSAGARAALEDLERAALAEVGAAAESEQGVAEASAAEQLEAIEQQIASKRDLLAALLLPGEPKPVVEALDRLRSLAVAEPVPSGEALELADELEAIDAELASLATVGEGDGNVVAAARARLDDARAALLEAEHAVRMPQLDRDDVLELEAVHAEVLDALDKAGSRFGGGRAQRRLDAARAREAEVLGRLGFISYTDYLTGSSLLHVDPNKEAALDAAREELAAAEDEWVQLQEVADRALMRAGLLDRRRVLVERAALLLGRTEAGPTVVSALRGLRVPPGDPRSALEDLRRALEVVGVVLGADELDVDDLMLLADGWLAESERAARRHDDGTAELVDLESRRRALAARVTGAPTDVRPCEEAYSAGIEERLTAARAELAEADARIGVHEAAETRSLELAAELQAAVAADDAAGAELAESEQALAVATAEERTAVESLRALEDEAAAVDREQARASAELRALERGLVDGAVDRLRAEVAVRERELEAARSAADSVAAELARAEAARARVLQPVTEPTAEGADGPPPPVTADELEWYLLARMAGQRSVSYAGSVPLLLDDALDGIDGAVVGQVLGRLERMAEAVQVIVVSDDPAVTSWALAAGPQRAALVRPGPPENG